jgi:internalin A
MLWKLRIDNNLIERLPESMGRLTNLEIFSASSNRLKDLPRSLFCLQDKLTMLIVNDNTLKRLPSALGSLKKLRVLYLHNNCLRKIPNSIGNLKDLQEFSLEWLMYVQPPLNKILRSSDDKGRLFIKEFLSFA